MSATEEVSAPEGSGAETSSGLPAASLPESLGLLLTAVVPALVRGLFSPRRTAVRVLGALEIDRRAVGVASALRRKHGGEGVRLLGGRLVVLWGPSAIKEVLDSSAWTYASDSGAKAKGMSHFQPDALTLSRGERWRERRTFNEAVLGSDQRLHPFAARFLAVVDDEVDRMRIGDKLGWAEWERLFDRIALRVIFGDRARSEQRLTELLEKLMGEANRLVGLSPNDSYYEFIGLLESQLRDPEPESLLAGVAQAPHGDDTRVVQQIPHWMFAMRDTLAANSYRALAAIVADQVVLDGVMREVEGAAVTDPDAVGSWTYLEGCLQEAMRLWPTTPLLARETTESTTLAGEQLEEGTQVLMLGVFNHRDPDHVEDADALVPERWADGERDYRFNHLSNGSQDCPGAPLVLLLGKAAIARILKEYELTLASSSLTGARSLPYTLDIFELEFTADRRGD